MRNQRRPYSFHPGHRPFLSRPTANAGTKQRAENGPARGGPSGGGTVDEDRPFISDLRFFLFGQDFYTTDASTFISAIKCVFSEHQQAIRSPGPLSHSFFSVPLSFCQNQYNPLISVHLCMTSILSRKCHATNRRGQERAAGKCTKVIAGNCEGAE